MPSVPSSTDSGNLAQICPHAAKMMLLNGEGKTNGEAMLGSETKLKVAAMLNGSSGHKLTMNGENGHHVSNGHTNGESNGLAKEHPNLGAEEEEEEDGGEGLMERKWIRPDLPSKCTWRLGGPNVNNPHHHVERYWPAILWQFNMSHLKMQTKK